MLCKCHYEGGQSGDEDTRHGNERGHECQQTEKTQPGYLEGEGDERGGNEKVGGAEGDEDRSGITDDNTR